MKQRRGIGETGVIGLLLAVSLVLYSLHYLCFHDLHFIALYSMTSLAFLPLSALVVTLLINRVLSARNKAQHLEKLNMLIGIFFSKIGNDLLSRCSDSDSNDRELRERFGSAQAWEQLLPRQGLLDQHDFAVSMTARELAELKTFLASRLDDLVRLMENPNLLEHEHFTQLLRAVFHLAEELSYRDHLDRAPKADLAHLHGDVQRAYALLCREWLRYMFHLRDGFPFLFSLAVRTNPLDQSAAVVIQD